MSKLLRLCSVFVISFVLFACSVTAQSLIVENDIKYRTVDDRDLKLDFARPDGKGPFPLVLCIHGGGWQLGDKKSHRQTIQMLARNGYAAATVEYRLSTVAPFPAQIEDLKCALHFLRAHAEVYGIDSQHVGVLGDSAGGHLALLMALIGPKDGFESDCAAPGTSSQVQAAVNFYGPTDFRIWHVDPSAEDIVIQAYGKGSDEVLADFVGTSDRSDERMERVSPVAYVDSSDPPILSFHGTADPLVSSVQARTLHEELRKAGVVERLELLEGASHGWTGPLKDKTTQLMLDFLAAHLKEQRSEN